MYDWFNVWMLKTIFVCLDHDISPAIKSHRRWDMGIVFLRKGGVGGWLQHQQLVRKDMDVIEHKRLFSITLRHKFK
jgi:hypothetical protein